MLSAREKGAVACRLRDLSATWHIRHCAPRNNRKRSFAFSRHDLPEFCFGRDPSKGEGAGKAGCSASTRSLARRKKRTSVVATGSPKQSDFPAQWFTAYSVLSPATGRRPGCFATVASWITPFCKFKSLRERDDAGKIELIACVGQNQLSIDRHDPIRAACSALRVEMT